jgi:hypothetical protein
MAIRWSATKVSEAMNEVQKQLDQAEPFILQALARAREARRIPDLAGYVDDRLARLASCLVDDFGRIKASVTSVRQSIPDGAIETEKAKTKYGERVAML